MLTMPKLRIFVAKLKLHFFNTTYRNIFISNIVFLSISKFGQVFIIDERKVDEPTNLFRIILTKKFYLHAYQACFSELKILEAYKYRFLSINLILKHGSVSQKKAALNYLYLFKNSDLIDNLDISLKTKKYLKDLLMHYKPASTKSFTPICNAGSEIAIIGPMFDFNSMNETSAYKYIICTKPPPDEVLKSTNSKFIIFPGPTWSSKNTSMIKIYQKKFDNIKFSYFWSVEDGSFIEHINEKYNFPFGAWLMNLQRLLIFSRLFFPNSKIYVDGFNFLLTKNIWNSWYKKQLVSSSSDHPVWSPMKHDYLASLVFSKNYFQDNKNFHGPTVEILKQDIQTILKIFIDTYQKKI